MAIHKIKTWPPQFGEILNGAKRHEVRNNDRGYQNGDTVIMREWCPEKELYTGAWVQGLITNTTLPGVFGLTDDVIVFTFKPMLREHRTKENGATPLA